MVSPIALPIPSTIAVKTPDLAAGKITLNIVSILDAPKAKDASLYCFGTDLIAVSATEIIVGSIITERTIIMASKLCPLGRDNLLWIAGTIIPSAKTPNNTEGIPANNSTPWDIIFATDLGAISTIKIAVNIPMGTPITRELRVPYIEAIIIGRIPYFSELGIHSVPSKNSPKEYPLDINGVKPL